MTRDLEGNAPPVFVGMADMTPTLKVRGGAAEGCSADNVACVDWRLFSQLEWAPTTCRPTATDGRKATELKTPTSVSGGLRRARHSQS